MAKIERFEDLGIWKKAVAVGVFVYELADKDSLSKDYKSRGQFIDAATSISNNIAEGFEYNSNRSFINFLRYAKGSAGEVRSQAYVLVLSGRITEDDYQKLYGMLTDLSKEIKGFMEYLKSFEQKRANSDTRKSK